MTGLAALQRDLSQYLLQEANAASVRPVVKVPPRIDPVERLEVYGNAYRERLRETLAKDYPVLLRLLGAEAFAELAYGYIAANRSRSPNIRWFGAQLAAFIAARPSPPHAAARDMAEFEWAIGLAFDAADAEPLAVADLASVAPDDWAALRFRLHPSLQAIALTHAAPDWWLGVQDLDGQAGLPDLPPLEHERSWAIWRGAEGVRFRLLEVDEADMLRAARDNADFGTLCGLLAMGHGEMQAAPRAAGLLRNWVEAGWIAGLG